MGFVLKNCQFEKLIYLMLKSNSNNDVQSVLNFPWLSHLTNIWIIKKKKENLFCCVGVCWLCCCWVMFEQLNDLQNRFALSQ